MFLNKHLFYFTENIFTWQSFAKCRIRKTQLQGDIAKLAGKHASEPQPLPGFYNKK